MWRYVAPLATLPEPAEYGTPPGASIKCTECASQRKNQIGAYAICVLNDQLWLRLTWRLVMRIRIRGRIERFHHGLRLRNRAARAILPNSQKHERDRRGSHQEFR